MYKKHILFIHHNQIKLYLSTTISNLSLQYFNPIIYQ